jgi:hypothetical protein
VPLQWLLATLRRPPEAPFGVDDPIAPCRATSLVQSSGTFEIAQNALKASFVAVVIFPAPEVTDIALIT